MISASVVFSDKHNHTQSEDSWSGRTSTSQTLVVSSAYLVVLTVVHQVWLCALILLILECLNRLR